MKTQQKKKTTGGKAKRDLLVEMAEASSAAEGPEVKIIKGVPADKETVNADDNLLLATEAAMQQILAATEAKESDEKKNLELVAKKQKWDAIKRKAGRFRAGAPKKSDLNEEKRSIKGVPANPKAVLALQLPQEYWNKKADKEETPEAPDVQLRWQEGQLRCITAMLLAATEAEEPEKKQKAHEETKKDNATTKAPKNPEEEKQKKAPASPAAPGENQDREDREEAKRTKAEHDKKAADAEEGAGRKAQAEAMAAGSTPKAELDKQEENQKKTAGHERVSWPGVEEVPAQQPQMTLQDASEHWSRKVEQLRRELGQKIEQEECAWRSFEEAKKNRIRIRAGARHDKIEEERWNIEKELKAALATEKAMLKKEQSLEAALEKFRPPSPPSVITARGETMTLMRYHAGRAEPIEEVN